MLVSFYAQAAIILLSLFLTLLPFLGFPHVWTRVLVAVSGALILGISLHSLYVGYMRAIARMERKQRLSNRERRTESPDSEE